MLVRHFAFPVHVDIESVAVKKLQLVLIFLILGVLQQSIRSLCEKASLFSVRVADICEALSLARCFSVLGFHFGEQLLPGFILRFKARFVQQFLQRGGIFHLDFAGQAISTL